MVDWRTLRQAHWISDFGNWRLNKGEQGHGQILTLQPPVELDAQRGLLHTSDGSIALALFEPQFQLIADQGPDVRVYRVR